MASERRSDARALRLISRASEPPRRHDVPTTTIVHVVGEPSDQRTVESVAAGLQRPQVEQVVLHPGVPPGGAEMRARASGIFAHPTTTARWLRVAPATRHGARTAALLRALESALVQDRPDVVVIYGATDTALACALAAAKQNIAITYVGTADEHASAAHQLNRSICERLADTLLLRSDEAFARLSAEGVPDTRMHIVGHLHDAERARAAGDVIVAHYVLQDPAGAAQWRRRFPRSSLHV